MRENEEFSKSKTTKLYILQEIPDLFSNLKCSNMQLYIGLWFIICMCKISVRNEITKDLLKKKTDVRWTSNDTVVFN